MNVVGSGRKWLSLAVGAVVIAVAFGGSVAFSRSASLHPVGMNLSAPVLADSAPLLYSWSPPPGLPTAGVISSVHIPPTQSGFAARDGQLYLPPAALVANPPALPFVMMMMGQPGDPDAAPIAQVLDQFAASHHGLAPIVVVADQLGDPDIDSLCLDTTAHGKVETYLQQDVVGWARAKLHILSDRAAWTVAGFSNGGECAVSLASKFPEVWGNVVSASGTAYAGVETESSVLMDVFGGNQDLYDATKPETVMAATSYPDTVAIFTVGADDAFIGPGIKGLSDSASAAGMHTSFFEIPGQGHTLEALIGGLTKAFEQLDARLGLTGQG